MLTLAKSIHNSTIDQSVSKGGGIQKKQTTGTIKRNENEYVGEAGRYIHLGLTSSDMLDTALALQLVASLDILLERIECLTQAIRYQAQQHRETVMIGRSHGIHAEPITFGFKLAGWLAEIYRNRERLVSLRDHIAVGKISGAVGTYANIDPKIEEINDNDDKMVLILCCLHLTTH